MLYNLKKDYTDYGPGETEKRCDKNLCNYVEISASKIDFLMLLEPRHTILSNHERQKSCHGLFRFLVIKIFDSAYLFLLKRIFW